MKWEQGRRSRNVEDRRGRGLSQGMMIGGGAWVRSRSPLSLRCWSSWGSGLPPSAQSPTTTNTAPRSLSEDELADFVYVGLADTEDTWKTLFQQEFNADDRLQMPARGYVTPDSFTHGSSEQRMWWFVKGIQTGDIN